MYPSVPGVGIPNRCLKTVEAASFGSESRRMADRPVKYCLRLFKASRRHSLTLLWRASVAVPDCRARTYSPTAWHLEAVTADR